MIEPDALATMQATPRPFNPKRHRLLCGVLVCLLAGQAHLQAAGADVSGKDATADTLVVEIPREPVSVRPGATWGDVLKFESTSYSRVRQTMAVLVPAPASPTTWTQEQLRLALSCQSTRPCVFRGAAVLRIDTTRQQVSPSQWEDAILAAGTQRWGQRFASQPWQPPVIKSAELPTGAITFTFAPGARFNPHEGEFEAEVHAMQSGRVLASRQVRWRARPAAAPASTGSAVSELESIAQADDAAKRANEAKVQPASRAMSPHAEANSTAWAVRKGMQASLRVQDGPFLAEWPVRCLSDGQVGQIVDVIRLSGGQRHRAKVIDTNLLEMQ